MFESLKEFDHIFVTGPQRSGTTICGKMIAQDTGHKYVDEFSFHVANRKMLEKIMSESSRNVYQCPGLCRFMHEYSDDKSAIVLMRRDVKSIIASQDRINWKCDRIELVKYREEERFGFETISEIKYAYWDRVQKDQIKNVFEVQYDSLSTHPLWVEQEKRIKFHPKQTHVFIPLPKKNVPPG